MTMRIATTYNTKLTTNGAHHGHCRPRRAEREMLLEIGLVRPR